MSSDSNIDKSNLDKFNVISASDNEVQKVSENITSNQNKNDSGVMKKIVKVKSRVQSKRSYVWDYYEHPVTNGVIDKTKVRCLKCGEFKNYLSSTTNMITHLKSKHYHVMAGN